MDRPVAYMGEEPYVFVSYSHKDSERVWPIIARLQADRFRVWYDDGINPGTEWDSNIASHIKNCSFFLVFITENYLASENCKDELSFVRELKKNRVLAYLDEVALPDEMQMRLGRLQAIYWPRLGDEKAYGKLMRSSGLDICREPEPVPAAPEPPVDAVAPAPAEAAAPAQDTEVIPDKPVKPAVSPAKTAPAPNQSTKKNPLIFAGIAAAILLILVVVFVVKPSGSNKTKSLKGVLSVYKNGVVSNPQGTPLAGVLTCYKDFDYESAEQQTLDYNGDNYKVAQVPYITISSYDDQNSIILGFYDEFGAKFYFYGKYAIEGDLLTISPGGSAGSFDTDCAPLTRVLTYRIVIDRSGVNLYYAKEHVILAGSPIVNNTLVLKGSLSDEKHCYKSVKSLDLSLDIKFNVIENCILLLDYEGETATANISSFNFYENINCFYPSWNSIEFTQNGRKVTKDLLGSVSINYINQSPAGFMIVDIGTNEIYYYQNIE